VEGPQEQDSKGAPPPPPIDNDSIELDILDDGADNQRVPTRLWDEGNGYLDHLRYSGVVGDVAITSRAVSFCFLLDSLESGPP
jgi:hypothetical protein